MMSIMNINHDVYACNRLYGTPAVR